MKNAVLFLALAIVLVVAGLVLTGGRAGRELTLTIDRPRGEVFEWITAPEKRREWRSGLVASTTADGKRLRSGSRTLETFQFGGERQEVRGEVKELVHGRRFAVLYKTPDHEAWVRYELEGSGNRTTLRYTNETRYEGFVSRLFAPLSSVSMGRRIADDLAHLRTRLELGS